MLYIADSESSTVRCVSLSDGVVRPVVGGDLDPTVSPLYVCARNVNTRILELFLMMSSLYYNDDICKGANR